MNKLAYTLIAASIVSLISSCAPYPTHPSAGYGNSPDYGTLPRHGAPPSVVDRDLNRHTQKFPQTVALEKELGLMNTSFNATSSRVQQAKARVKSARDAAEKSVNMIEGIRSVENQITRLEKEINSLKNIPQLKVLKPLAKGITSMKIKVHKIRVKAEKVRDKKIIPAIKKMKVTEAKLAKLDASLRHASIESAYAQRHVAMLRKFVIFQNSPIAMVQALEVVSKTARQPVTPAQRALSEFDGACSDLERRVNTYNKYMLGLVRLKPGLDKVKEKMAPVDKQLKNLAKVLDKRIGFKKFSFTVRKVIESPGKIGEAALKPLRETARKLLAPITKKFQIKLNAPSELQKISTQIDAINRLSFDLNSPLAKLDSPSNLTAIANYNSSLKRLRAVSTAQLQR